MWFRSIALATALLFTTSCATFSAVVGESRDIATSAQEAIVNYVDSYKMVCSDERLCESLRRRMDETAIRIIDLLVIIEETPEAVREVFLAELDALVEKFQKDWKVLQGLLSWPTASPEKKLSV